MTLTIVITTYNRRSVLRALLEHLESQIDRNFEVVVVMDGSTDGTQEMLSSLATSYSLRWGDTGCSGYGLAMARNQGILAARGMGVVILDDDSFPSENFVGAHRSSVQAGVITGGPRRPSDDDNIKMQWKLEQLLRLPPRQNYTIPQLRQEWPNVYLIENNICLLREDWISIGLFSERLKMYGFIGQEFFGRAEFFGFRYQVNPEAEIIHHGEFEGDNGLRRSKKMREARLARLVLPALTNAKHYRAQAAWANARAAGVPVSPMPGYLWAAASSVSTAVMSAGVRRIQRYCGPRIGSGKR